MAILRTSSTAGIFSSVLFLTGCGGAPGPEEVDLGGETTATLEEGASIARTAYLIPQWSEATSSPFFKWQCADPVDCVDDRNEADDGSIDVGLYSKNIGQYVILRLPSIRDVAVNWDRATQVDKVQVISALQATRGGYPCTLIGGSINTSENGEDLYKEFETKYCSTPGDPARSLVDTLPAPGGQWTWAKLNNGMLRVWARRIAPAGPSHYLASFYVKVSYRAP